MIDSRRPDESLSDYLARVAPSKAPEISPTPLTAAAEDMDLIPDVELTKSPERYEMDKVLSIDCVEAYNRWSGKPSVSPGTKRKNIMISCPIPGHTDKEPSADINLELGDGGVWHCHKCAEGGDKYDIAAYHFGFDVPGYKSKDQFPKLREAMAEDLGYKVMVSGKEEWLEKNSPSASVQSSTTSSTVGSTTTTDHQPTPSSLDDSLTTESTSESKMDPGSPSPTLTEVDEYEPDADRDYVNPTFNWRDLDIKPQTFLNTWMNLTSESFEPEEFYFWEGLVALGMAVGNHVIHPDSIAEVRGNLMVCLIGETGTGKSIAMSLLEKLLYEALPFDASTGSGARVLGSAASGESLLDMFCKSVTDASTGVVTPIPVRGLMNEDELASLMKRVGRAGNTLREVMMKLYDRPLPVSLSGRMSGSITATDHYMSVITSTQPASIQKFLTDADAAAGFLNRWVFVFGKPKRRPAITTFRVDITPAVDSLRAVRAWAGLHREIDWSTTDLRAIDLWTEFYDKRVYPLSMRVNAPLAARLPLLAKKIMLLLAINDHSESIQYDHVRTMIRMWKYLLKAYGIVETEVRIGANDTKGCMDALERYMAERPGDVFTLRILEKQSGAKRFSRETILKSLEVMMRFNIVTEVPRGKSDRTIKYTYNAESGMAPPKLTVIHGGDD
jgi:hypothetical protein